MGEHLFVIGAQRSGSTLLYRLLQDHPEIEMARPARPEPKFFLSDDLYERGLDWYRRRFFPADTNARYLGEKSTSYIESPIAAQRIARDCPEAWIVAILRDPIARAASNHRFSVENGLETLPFEEAILREEERRGNYDPQRVSVSPFAYLRRGRYAEQLDVWRDLFSEERMIVLVLERFAGSTRALRGLWARLGVDENHLPDSLGEVINASAAPRVDPTPELERQMLDYFREPNQRLARCYALDLGAWQR